MAWIELRRVGTSLGYCPEYRYCFLAIALYQMEILNEKKLFMSIGAFFGTACGMLIGGQIRQYISEGLFRKILLCFLMVLGTYIVTNALNDLEVPTFSIS